MASRTWAPSSGYSSSADSRVGAGSGARCRPLPPRPPWAPAVAVTATISSSAPATRPAPSARSRSRMLAAAERGVAKLEQVLRADRDVSLHLGLGGHDVEAPLADALEDLLGYLRGRIAAGQPVGQALPEGLGHRAGLALLAELLGPVARRSHDVRVDETGA